MRIPLIPIPRVYGRAGDVGVGASGSAPGTSGSRPVAKLVAGYCTVLALLRDVLPQRVSRDVSFLTSDSVEIAPSTGGEPDAPCIVSILYPSPAVGYLRWREYLKGVE